MRSAASLDHGDRSIGLRREGHTSQRNALSVEQLLGDGSNGAVDNALSAGEMITAIDLPPPLANERAAYQASDRPHPR